jgi:hypothetical protein
MPANCFYLQSLAVSSSADDIRQDQSVFGSAQTAVLFDPFLRTIRFSAHDGPETELPSHDLYTKARRFRASKNRLRKDKQATFRSRFVTNHASAQMLKVAHMMQRLPLSTSALQQPARAPRPFSAEQHTRAVFVPQG